MTRPARSGRRRQLLGLVALAAAAALAGVLVANWLVASAAARAPAPSDPVPAIAPSPVPTTPASATPVPEATDEPRASRPVRLEIPAIGVDAPVIKLGLNPDKSLEVPEDYSETGWWSGGPRPGELGPAVIAGHVDSTSGPAVFYRLGQLSKGDAIRVEGRDGTTTSFTVERIEQHPKDDFPTDTVYRSDLDRQALRLITCGGSFDSGTGHYRDNVIVFATLDSFSPWAVYRLGRSDRDRPLREPADDQRGVHP